LIIIQYKSNALILG